MPPRCDKREDRYAAGSDGVVYQRGDETHISAIDAERMLSIVGRDDLALVADEVRRRLNAVVERASASQRVRRSFAASRR